MEAFPATQVRDPKLLETVLNSVPEDKFITVKELRERLSKYSSRNVSNALSILVYLGLLEAKGRGRTRRYKRVNNASLLQAYIRANDVREVLRCLILGIMATARPMH